MVIVVYTGGEEPAPSLSQSWLGSCQWIIAADRGLEGLSKLGRVANDWIGDGDSLAGGLDHWKAQTNASMILDRDKDESDTEAAISLAKNRGAKEIWLIGGGGGRMDHWWSNLKVLARETLVTRWLTGHETIQILGPGDRLGVEQGVVSVFALSEGPWTIRSEGLRWPLDGVDFKQWYSLSNVVSQQPATIKVSSGRFMVMVPHSLGLMA